MWALAIAGFLALNLLSLLAGLALLGRFYPEMRLAERLLALAVLWATQVTVVVLFLGLAGGLSLTLVSATHGLISLLTLVFCRKHLWSSVRDFIGQWREALARLRASRAYLLYLMLAGVAAQFILTIRKAYYLPPHVFDELNQYLLPVALWLQNQKILIEMDSSCARTNAVPLGGKLLSFWFVRYTGDITWMEAPQLLFWPALLLASYCLMRMLSIGRVFALTYALVIAAIPAAIIESRTSQDHLLLTALFLTALVFLTRVIRGERSYIWLVALSTGLLLGIKISAPVYFVAVAGALAVAYRSTLFSALRPSRRLILVTLVFVLVIGSLGGYWYVKNIIVYGRISGSMPPPIVSGSPNPELSAAARQNDLFVYLIHFSQNWSDFPARVSDTGLHYTEDLTNISGFGPQFFAFGIIGYVVAIILSLARPRRRYLVFLLLIAVSLQFLYFIRYYSPYNYRLFLTTAAFGIIFWAYSFSRLRPNAFQRLLTEGLAALTIFFSCLGCYYVERTTPDKWFRLWTALPSSQRTSASYSELADHDIEIIDQYLPDRYPLAYVGDEGTLMFFYYGSSMQRRVEWLRVPPNDLAPAERQAQFARLFAEMKARGIRLLHVGLREEAAPPELSGLKKIGDRIYILP